MSTTVRLGSWILRRSGRSWMLARACPSGKLTHRSYYTSVQTGAEALGRAFWEEKGVVMPQETVAALRASADAWGEQLSLLGIGPEEEARDRALEAMEASELRQHYLEIIRKEMRRRAEAGLTATPDDARAFFESLDPPPPELLSRNFLGCTFRTGEWEVVGTYRSRTAGSHANRLNRYRLRKDN